VRHQVVHPFVEPGPRPVRRRRAAAEHVDHDDDGSGHRRRAEGVVEDGAQVLLELAGDGALDGPVAGVVRAHGELVDDHAVGRLEQLHGEHPDDAEPVGDPDGQLLRGGGAGVVEPRRGDEDLVADALPLDGLDHRPDGDLPERRPGDLHRELPDHRDALLGQQCAVARQELRRIAVVPDDEDTPPVVPAAGRLEHDRPAPALGECGDVRGGLRACPGGLRLPRRVECGPHDQLVLGVHERGRSWRDPGAGRLESAQVVGRHVLVVEGHHGGALGHPPQVVQAGVVAEDDVGGDERGRLGPVRRQHPQGLAECDRRLVGHAGELPSADHRHHGQAGTAVDGCGHGGC
jgi:hypothetical protein